MRKISIIIDTDPGIDDAIALAAACFSEALEVKLISTVSGNVGIENVTQNALKLVEFYGKEIPVAKGSGKPLIKAIETASNIHGENGMGGYTFKEPTRKILDKHSIEAMKDVILTSKEKITLVTIGPLTNIALLLETYPEVKNNIERIVFMGGSTERGNYSPAAEFNIATDPEAAKIVFNSKVDLVMLGLNVTSKALLDVETVEKLRVSNKIGEMFYSMFSHYRGASLEEGGIHMHDLSTIAYLNKPEIFKTTRAFVDVETKGEYTSGFTVVDLDNVYGKEPNATVCLDVDVLMFRKWLIDLFENMNI
ncbi:non-specific riboncleoside hydrolase [Clostridium cavendishii DSM 21758]|uniref:Non-specific riboncleoside hydrolase n=1 Tax=Clostridium cavendishii DSM 21758 TaxID=1121302 RepID=A0A1M6BBN9_9CLOT|nr:ribonucleoside hydrolase RihC [Clostridium cavendishii]SHI46087.1 non-specific riboncleoside hydrolase [Clostridium cavendishii DSM 21758]